MADLLTRDEFRVQVFRRDNHKCVVCGEDATAAHHIMDRKLWPDGGYYLNNGASVCDQHHWACEKNWIFPDELRLLMGIPTLLPPGLDPEFNYNKWGEPIGIKEETDGHRKENDE